MFKYPALDQQLEAVRQAVEWASGCSVYWNNQSDEGRKRDNKPWCTLRMDRLSTIAPTETLYEETPEGNYLEIITSQSQAEIVAEFRSRTQVITESGSYAAAKAKIRLDSDFVKRKFLNEKNVSLSSMGDVVTTISGVDNEGRSENEAELTFILNIAINETDENMTISTIEKTELTSELYKENVKMNPALQWDPELIERP